MNRRFILTPSLLLFVVFCSAAAITKPVDERAIGIQPLGNFPAEQSKEVKTALERYYHCKVEVLPTIQLPQEAYTEVKVPRYRADKILLHLHQNRPTKYDHVIGLTAKDISTTKYKDWATKKIKEPEWKYTDWGIFGLGQMPGPVCLVSTHRLKLKGGENNDLLLERLRKVSCHEIGHNLGLPHCENSEQCFMRDGAESINTVDTESESLCKWCAIIIGLKD